MKSIGIIRRIDSLGRIVIPKEIRKKLKIVENDNLEIFVDDDKIYIKKHTILDNNIRLINLYGSILRDLTNKNVIISNNLNIIYCNKGIIETFLNKEITEEAIKIINDRKITNGSSLEIIKNIKINNYISYPIILNSDSIGLIIMYGDNINESNKKSLEIISKIINQSLE